MDTRRMITYAYDAKGGIEMIISRNRALFYPVHNHVSVYAAGLLLEGSLVFSAGEERRLIGEGETFIVPPYLPHSIESEGVCTLLTVCINKNRILPSDEGKFPVLTPDIARLAGQMERFPEMSMDTGQMARSVCMSKYHFIRSFKEEVGLTPHRFLLQNRIRKAQRLLRFADQLSGPALMAGFYDQSHFIRQFKKIVGLTPSAYKDACMYL